MKRNILCRRGHLHPSYPTCGINTIDRWGPLTRHSTTTFLVAVWKQVEHLSLKQRTTRMCFLIICNCSKLISSTTFFSYSSSWCEDYCLFLAICPCSMQHSVFSNNKDKYHSLLQHCPCRMIICSTKFCYEERNKEHCLFQSSVHAIWG